MPVSKPQDLPRGGGDRWPLCGAGFRSVQWGDLEVGYTDTGAGDHTLLYRGLPGDVCPAPTMDTCSAGACAVGTPEAIGRTR